MKQHDLDPMHFNLIKSMDEFARNNGLSIRDPATKEDLLRSMEAKIDEHMAHEARIIGFHVESLFAFVAAALGGCKLISEVDSGLLYSNCGEIIRPDFRIVTNTDEQFFVEVKNFYQKNSPTKEYKIKGEYLRSLKNFARQTKTPLKLAIYWSAWNKWTLIDADLLDCSQKTISFGLGDAYALSEMRLLGDCWLATPPPLSMRFHTNKSKPREIDNDGVADFYIENFCLCANGNEIVDPVENAIAWFLMNNGTWSKVEKPVATTGSSIDAFEVQFYPEAPTGELPFEVLGMLSEMISIECRRSVTKDGEIENLIPSKSNKEYGALIPRNFEGSVLKLSRLFLEPNKELLRSKPTGQRFLA